MGNASTILIMEKFVRTSLFIIVFAFLASCSFDYGGATGEGEEKPDIVMKDFDFVRVSDKKIDVRLQGDEAKHWEKDQRMEVRQARFAQYNRSDASLASSGLAGRAEIDFDSGDVVLSEGVQVYIQQEDTLIESGELHWHDKAGMLIAPDSQTVLFKNDKGSIIQGRGFGADARRRAWELAGGVEGNYVHEDKKESATEAEEEVPVVLEEEEGEHED